MNFLFKSAHYFEYLTSYICQGLTNLGHQCFCINKTDNSYLIPWNGELVDVYIDSYPKLAAPPEFILNTNIPKVLLWTYDLDDGPQPFHSEKFPWFNIYFIRELINESNGNVYPMDYAIDDRYYCITNSNNPRLSDRKFSATFAGSYRGNKLMNERAEKLQNIELRLKKYKPIIGRQETFKSNPDPYWSKWVRGRFHHDTNYFEFLTQSKIIISPKGGGWSCGRTFEAFASGALPMIEKSPIVKIEPSWETLFPEIVWKDTDEAVHKISYYLDNLEEAQVLADKVFEFAKNNWTTTHRAQFMLDKMKEHNLL